LILNSNKPIHPSPCPRFSNEAIEELIDAPNKNVDSQSKLYHNHRKINIHPHLLLSIDKQNKKEHSLEQ